MRKLVLLSLFISIILGSAVVLPKERAYAASSTCQNGVLTIDLPKPGNFSRWAIRVDKTTNPWNPSSPFAGDVIENNFLGSAYTLQVENGVKYGWWAHMLDTQGRWSDVGGGEAICKLPKPANLDAHCGSNFLKISWSEVKNANAYAIRINDLTNGWQGNSPLPGDVSINDSNRSYSLRVNPSHKFTWWVHAVDKYGIASEASIANACM